RCPTLPIWKSSRCPRSRTWSRRQNQSVIGEDIMSSPFDSNPSRPFEALQVPPAALERGGVEILRCAVIDDGLHVTLRPVFDDTRMWGRVLADVARQLAHAYAHQERGA